MEINRFEAPLAQSVEHRLRNHTITGSIPGIGKYLRKDFPINLHFYHLSFQITLKKCSRKGLAIQFKKCCLLIFVNIVSFMFLLPFVI